MASFISQIEKSSDALPPLPKGEPLNIVLVGKTGQGKSDTGNTILEGDFFDSSDDVVSVTKTNKSIRAQVGGRSLNIVDTPGCMDTKKGDDILEEIAKAITTHPEGYDAFLLVLKYPLRMTDEEVKTINQVEKLFGQDVYDYAVVIFTHGDSFEAKQKKARKQGKAVHTFQQYVEKDLMSGDEHSLAPLIKKVKDRVLLFNNMEEDAIKKRKMVCDLVRKIDGNQRSQRYNNDIFDKAQELEEAPLTEAEKTEEVVKYVKKNHPGSLCCIL